jgi:hemoglobin-like flavoprotein
MQLVQESWMQMSVGVYSSDAFYLALFQAHPDIKPLFDGVDTLSEQSEKLYKTLALIVKYMNPTNPTGLDGFLRRLGAQHAQDYGVSFEQYEKAREFFLGILVRANLTEPSEEIMDAWAWAYDVVTGIMASAGECAD